MRRLTLALLVLVAAVAPARATRTGAAGERDADLEEGTPLGDEIRAALERMQ